MNWRATLSTLFFLGLMDLPTNASAAGLDLNPDELKGETKKNPVAVLQNRFFLKSRRPELGILVGTVTNEAYTDTKTRGMRFDLFLNEWVGVEAQYILTTVTDSADRKALNQKTYRDRQDPNKLVTADAEVNSIQSIQDYVLVASPLYGKVNILDLAIVYVDVYASLGASRVKTDQGTKNALAIGGGQKFFFAERWSLRLDFRNRSYTETRAGKSSRKNSWTVDLGLGCLFL